MIVLGLMSGSSLDGLDCALVKFDTNNTWKLLAECTIGFPLCLHKKLKQAHEMSGFALMQLDADLGLWMGKQSKQWLSGMRLPMPDLISSHGHTIFHEPQIGFTTQIGQAAAIAQQWQRKVAYNFRALDVAHGGQGAPLVPIGDQTLFPGYDIWLNLGGIANATWVSNTGNLLATDLTACNQIMDMLAQQIGAPFDKDGLTGLNGTVQHTLLHALNTLPWVQQKSPKSLSNQTVSSIFSSLFNTFELTIPDKMRTLATHIAMQVKLQTAKPQQSTVFLSGGGAFNANLRAAIESEGYQVYLPNPAIIRAKEAIIFAYLGYLLCNNKINVLASVTNGSQNTVSGSITGFGFS